MKHVPNGYEEKTAADGAQGPVLKIAREASKKEPSQQQARLWLDCSSNRRRMRRRIRCELSRWEKIVSNARVGVSGDTLVGSEKALQQAERRFPSHRKSRKSGRREENLQVMTWSSVFCREQSKLSGKGPSRR